MKTLLFTFLLLQTSFSVFSQTVYTFPDSNAVWQNGYYEIVHDPYSPLVTTVLKSAEMYCMGTADTTINDLTYSKLYYCGGAYKGATRVEDQSVYFIPKDSSEHFLLYKFNPTVGDLLHDVYMEDAYQNSPGLVNLEVTEIQNIEVDGMLRKEIQFLNGTRWIEGIGNPVGLFRGSGINVSDYELRLDCMSQNDTAFYPSYSLDGCERVLANEEQHSSNQALMLFPNPSSDYTILEWNEQLKVIEVSIYNNLGEEIQTMTTAQQTHRLEVNTSTYPEGCYWLMVRTSDQFFSKQLIKINSPSAK